MFVFKCQQMTENDLRTVKLELWTCFPVGQLEPITLLNRAGVHVSLHFARDGASGHPGVAVVVMSAVNTSALQVKDFMFQAAVPKVKRTCLH